VKQRSCIRRMSTLYKAILLFLFTIVLCVAVTGSAAEPRIVAVGDVHGDLDSFVQILRRAGLVDLKQGWSGRDAILVQTGDFTDRGPKVRAVMDFLMSLQKEAPRQKGRVIVLMGNHEAMNIFGDLGSVTADDFASFADGKSEARQKSAYKAYSELPAPDVRQSEAEWMKSHPAGFVEYRDAMGPAGKYGKWLRTLPAVAKVGDSIFLHGGINPALSTWSLDKINEGIATEIKAFDAYKSYMMDQKIALPFFTLQELIRAAGSVEDKKPLEGFLNIGGWLSIHPDGPLWFRGYAQWSDTEGLNSIQQLTTAFKVSRFVVGHTPQIGRIVKRFDGQVVLIDTGMLSSYFKGGQASALQIGNGSVTAIYANGKAEPHDVR